MRLWPKPRWDKQFWYQKIFNMNEEEHGGLFHRIKHAALTEGFIGILITGPVGSGKSTLAIKMLRAIYGNYSVVLRHCLFFKWEDLHNALTTAAREDYAYPAVIWDDAGVHASRYLYRTGPKRAEEIAALIQLIRTYTHCLILTAPHVEDIASFVHRRPGWIHFMLWRIGRYVSRVRVGTYVETIFKVKAVESPVEFTVNTYIPRKWYNEYCRIRRRYILLTHANENPTDENDS